MLNPDDFASPHFPASANYKPEDTRNEVVALIPALRAFARTFCRRPDDADDLVQETLLRALANLDKYQPGTRLKSWLFTIMRNCFCTRASKAKRETVGIKPEMSAKMTTAPAQEFGARLSEIQRALFRLPPHQREILTLIVILGESYEDAAQICGCAVGTVKSRLNRARKQLYHELGEVDRHHDELTGSLSFSPD